MMYLMEICTMWKLKSRVFSMAFLTGNRHKNTIPNSALKIAAEICVYTNENITLEKL